MNGREVDAFVVAAVVSFLPLSVRPPIIEREDWGCLESWTVPFPEIIWNKLRFWELCTRDTSPLTIWDLPIINSEGTISITIIRLRQKINQFLWRKDNVEDVLRKKSAPIIDYHIFIPSKSRISWCYFEYSKSIILFYAQY